MSAFSFPQFTQILSRIFLTFTINPTAWIYFVMSRQQKTLSGHTWMEDRPGQLYMTKMTWTLRHPLSTCLALKVPVDSAKTRVHQASHLWLMRGFVHNFGMFNLSYGIRFLQLKVRTLSG